MELSVNCNIKSLAIQQITLMSINLLITFLLFGESMARAVTSVELILVMLTTQNSNANMQRSSYLNYFAKFKLQIYMV